MAQQISVSGPRYAPTLAGGSLALAALTAGILGGVPPTDCLIRGAAAYAVGWTCGQVWYVCFAGRVQDRTQAAATPARATPKHTPGEET